MNVYILEHLVFHGQYYTFVQRLVVVADSEKQAREMAANESGSEGSDRWLDDKLTSCIDVSTIKDPKVICIDFIDS